MKKILFFLTLILSSQPALLHAQDQSPAPMPPNYELVRKETSRWFGEYNYRRLKKRFLRCDTTMTVDHFRCLYYGAALGGRAAGRDPEIKLSSYSVLYVNESRLHGPSSAEANAAWWRLQMLLTAVWSSGNGTEEYPFHVTSLDDLLFMVDDLGLHCSGLPSALPTDPPRGEPIPVPTMEGETVYIIIGAGR